VTRRVLAAVNDVANLMYLTPAYGTFPTCRLCARKSAYRGRTVTGERPLEYRCPTSEGRMRRNEFVLSFEQEAAEQPDAVWARTHGKA